MKRLALMALASAVAIAAAAPASAAVYFAYSLNGGATVTQLGAADTSGNAGFNGTAGGYTFNLSATSFPLLTQPNLLTNSINVQTDGVRNAGTLIVYITQTDLNSFNGPVLSTFTSQTQQGSAQSATLSTFFNNSNASLPSTGTALASATFNGIGTAGSVNTLNGTGLFSMTAAYSLTFGTGTGNFNNTINVQPVPEPATWGMMLLGFGVVGSAMRRRSAKKIASFA